MDTVLVKAQHPSWESELVTFSSSLLSMTNSKLVYEK
jgi:hypothetical protein